MALRVLLAVLAVTAVAASGCSKDGAPSSPTSLRQMPDGYEAVDAAFGFRAGGLVHDAGRYTVPVAEFRTGGDYALYPVVTTCSGSFAQGEGTLFAADGTIRETLSAHGERQLSAHPQYAALFDRVCEEVRNSRHVADPFKPRDALALLLGPLDADEEAMWTPDAGSDLPEGVKWISLRRSGAFEQDGERWSYILTGSRDLDCDARACGGGALGGALFRYRDGKWLLASHTPLIAVAGSFGQTVGDEQIHELHADGEPPLLRIDIPTCHMGHCDRSTLLVAVVDGQLSRVWDGVTAENNEGTGHCMEGAQCTDWTAEVDAVAGSAGAHPDIALVRQGQAWDDARGRLTRIDERIVYRYGAGGRYEEQSREGGVVDLPPPAVAVDEVEAASGEALEVPVDVPVREKQILR